MDLVCYNGEHSATFGGEWNFGTDTATFEGGLNSWKDWHLIPISKLGVSPPSVKMKTVDIPGMHGSLDFSTVLTGYPTYSNRTGSFSFLLAPGYWDIETAKSAIMNKIQGRPMKVYLDDDPGYFWNGTVWVNEAKSDSRLGQITINYDFYPFKMNIRTSEDPWLWDPFNFETDMAVDYSNMIVNDSLLVQIEDAIAPVMPSFTVSSAMTMEHYYLKLDGTAVGKHYELSEGLNTPGLTMKPGINSFLFQGNGTVGISYRGGKL